MIIAISYQRKTSWVKNMAVVTNDLNALTWPNNKIPYECTDASMVSLINEFNTSLGLTLFIGRTNENDYIVITKVGAKDPHGSEIGKKGGKQELKAPADKAILFHEMGHACGLGHEFFHTQAPDVDAIGEPFLRMSQEAGQKRGTPDSKYRDGTIDYDENSIMGYVAAGGNQAFDLSSCDKVILTFLYS
jgi:hypothetical protein